MIYFPVVSIEYTALGSGKRISEWEVSQVHCIYEFELISGVQHPSPDYQSVSAKLNLLSRDGSHLLSTGVSGA